MDPGPAETRFGPDAGHEQRPNHKTHRCDQEQGRGDDGHDALNAEVAVETERIHRAGEQDPADEFDGWREGGVRAAPLKWGEGDQPRAGPDQQKQDCLTRDFERGAASLALRDQPDREQHRRDEGVAARGKEVGERDRRAEDRQQQRRGIELDVVLLADQREVAEEDAGAEEQQRVSGTHQPERSVAHPVPAAEAGDQQRDTRGKLRQFSDLVPVLRDHEHDSEEDERSPEYRQDREHPMATTAGRLFELDYLLPLISRENPRLHPSRHPAFETPPQRHAASPRPHTGATPDAAPVCTLGLAAPRARERGLRKRGLGYRNVTVERLRLRFGATRTDGRRVVGPPTESRTMHRSGLPPSRRDCRYAHLAQEGSTAEYIPASPATAMRMSRGSAVMGRRSSSSPGSMA